MAIKINCINKDNGNHENPYEAISHYGWVEDVTGKSDVTARSTVVGWVESGTRAYVSSYEGVVDCFVNRSPRGTKFLQTNADSRSSNNLLNLPECR